MEEDLQVHLSLASIKTGNAADLSQQFNLYLSKLMFHFSIHFSIHITRLGS